MTPTTLTELKAAWLTCKQAERTAAAQRLEVEQQMLALLPAQGEGTVTDKELGVSVIYKLTRKVDTDALRTHWMSLPPEARDAFRWSASVDTAALRSLQEHRPDLAAAALHYITTSPAKPGFSVKE